MELQYYSDKLESLQEIFGATSVHLRPGCLIVDGRSYPVVDDVIILLDPSQYPQYLKGRFGGTSNKVTAELKGFAEDIQFHYGECWKQYARILPEHEREFREYFDIVDPEELHDLRVCDLGCGMGRWSFILQNKCKCRELILVDFSEGIFVARDLLKEYRNAFFFMGDLTRLPFRENFTDFLFCLGVLHHLPLNALDQVRRLRKYSKNLLIYLYYALDNRPFYFRALLALVTPVRLALSRIRNPVFRNLFCWFAVFFIHMPCIWLGAMARPLGLSRHVPLYEDYHWVSLEGLHHHVYDRFFTGIEQRFTRAQIMALRDTYDKVIVSENPGYWHFLCVDERSAAECSGRGV